VIGLFGIINYFQTADGVRRLAEVEQALLWSERELIVTRVFARLLSNLRIDARVKDNELVNICMARVIRHLYTIAAGLDLSSENDLFEYVSSFLELSKIGGHAMCQRVIEELESVGPYSVRYGCLVESFRNYLSRIRRWE
jgi:hypothetical protein